jgi:hypothetical protein
MYSFEDRNGDSLSLRPEGTASCVRAAIEHGLLVQPQRLWYRGPMFRHERPQRGRYRQFNQIGAEVFGLAGPDIDLELILLTARLWRALGLNGLRLEINSLGDPEERRLYREQLVTYLEARREHLDAESLRRLHTNPCASWTPNTRDTEGRRRCADADGSPRRGEPGPLSRHPSRSRQAGIPYRLNPRLVRGLDYYNRTVFEWITEDLGAQGTVCAGGRYDGLVEQLGGRATPAVGFRLGPRAPGRAARARGSCRRARGACLPGRGRRSGPARGPELGRASARCPAPSAPHVALRRGQLQEPVQEGRQERRNLRTHPRRGRAGAGHRRRQTLAGPERTAGARVRRFGRFPEPRDREARIDGGGRRPGQAARESTSPRRAK